WKRSPPPSRIATRQTRAREYLGVCHRTPRRDEASSISHKSARIRMTAKSTRFPTTVRRRIPALRSIPMSLIGASSEKHGAHSARDRSHDFLKFWTGETISSLGSSFTQFALSLLVFKLTGSALNLGIAFAFSFLPHLLFGLVIGAWVDRLDRKRVMILAD